MKLSVITPTYNPRMDYLRRVFAGLTAQSLDKSDWEYILVDNNSSPPLAGQVDLSWHPNARVVVEAKQGLTPARLRGFAEAKAGLVVMVDDDCVIAPDFLETALRLMREHSFIGVLGGYFEAEYEKPTEPWLEAFKYILLDFRDKPERRLPLQYAMAYKGGPWLPVGAAMVIRSSVVVEYHKAMARIPERAGFDRTGKGLLGSGDTDIALTAVDLGLAMANSGFLRATHLIPVRRTELNYVRNLLYASSYGGVQLMIRRGLKQVQTGGKPKITGMLRRWLSSHRRRSPVEQCREAIHLGIVDAKYGRPYDEFYR